MLVLYIDRSKELGTKPCNCTGPTAPSTLCLPCTRKYFRMYAPFSLFGVYSMLFLGYNKNCMSECRHLYSWVLVSSNFSARFWPSHVSTYEFRCDVTFEHSQTILFFQKFKYCSCTHAISCNTKFLKEGALKIGVFFTTCGVSLLPAAIKAPTKFPCQSCHK